MLTLKIIFWIFFFIIFYAYLGYGILLFMLIKIKRILVRGKNPIDNIDYEPEVTLFCTAFNEKDYVEAKVKNSRSLEYPKEKVHQIWVTDGSDDGTPELLRKYEGVEVFHLAERAGKIAAMNRGMHEFADL